MELRMHPYIICLSLCLGLIAPSLEETTRKYPHEECKIYPPMKDFNESKFFNGTWYLVYAQYSEKTRLLANCETTKAKILPTGFISLYTSSYYPEIKQFVNTESFLLQKEKNYGVYMGEARLYQPEGNKFVTDFITISFVVIDTDYENYALSYTCFYFESLLISYISVDYRNKTDIKMDIISVEKIMEFGIDFEDFYSTRNLTCLEDPNF